MKEDEIKNRVLEEARHVIDTHATVRATAKIFGVSKSNVHTDVTLRNGRKIGQAVPERYVPKHH